MYKVVSTNKKNTEYLIEACEIHNTKYHHEDNIIYILTIDEVIKDVILTTFVIIKESYEKDN
jgi:hypothetical protein